MIIVLHTANLEPITVVDLPIEAYKALQNSGIVRLDINGDKDISVHVSKMTISVKGDSVSTEPLYIVDNEVLALTLTPAFLTGQVYSIQRLCA